MMMRSFEEHKQYLKDLISHYEELIEMKPRNNLVSNFLNFIKEEKYKNIRRLRNIREKELECNYFAKTYKGFN